MNRKTRVFLSATLLLIVTMFFATSATAQTIPNERQLPRLVDAAYLLTDDEVFELEAKLDEISERQKLDVVVITIDELDEGYTPTEFADDVYDYNGFGMGSGADGILLLVSMAERDWAISTHGYGITAFTDFGQKYMTDIFVKELSAGNYYEAFDSFADLADDFISQARAGTPFDKGSLPKKPLSPIWIVISLVIGALVAFISTGGMKNQLKTVAFQRVATNYMVNKNIDGARSRDLFLYDVITRTEIPKESKSSGSSTHTSSSGRTHGGSSGKF